MIHYVRSLPYYKTLTTEERLLHYLDEKCAHSISVRDNGEKLVSLLTLPGSSLLGISPTIPNFLVRPEFGKRLIRAAQLLAKEDKRLILNELYRPIAQQREEFTQVTMTLSQQYPRASAKKLWEMTTQFIADPELTPPHCTGGAADVYLAHARTGQLLDMGAPLNTISEEATLMADTVSFEAKEHRLSLLRAMLEAGCAPMPTEWWHFSYGEKYWAAFYDGKAIYDVVDPGDIDSAALHQ